MVNKCFHHRVENWSQICGLLRMIDQSECIITTYHEGIQHNLTNQILLRSLKISLEIILKQLTILNNADCTKVSCLLYLSIVASIAYNETLIYRIYRSVMLLGCIKCHKNKFKQSHSLPLCQVHDDKYQSNTYKLVHNL